MNDLTRTLIYVAAALLLAFAAFQSTPGEVKLEFLEDTGTEFFPEFDDPAEATELAVIEFDEDRSAAVPFNVKRLENGLWTIPSHHNYPADGTARMAKAAALLIGLQKASVRSNTRADHQELGVVDALDEGIDLEGRGTRVTFKNSAGTVLADLIIGDEVADRPGQRYVRIPGENVTYTAELTLDVSTRFEDWIQTDLLDVASFDIEGLTFDNYSVDEARGAVLAGEKLEVEKVDGTWTLMGVELAEDEELDTSNVTTATSTLANLEIVGVRPKPAGLTAMLERAQGFERSILASDLQGRGFFLVGDKLYSNEGDLLVETTKGVVYTLKFGEIVFGSGDALTAGTGDATGADGNPPQNGDSAHRYLMITAAFDESLLDRPEGTPLPQEHLDERQRARRAIEQIVDAVNAYRDQNDALPESLSVLTEGDNPLLAGLEQDPWGADYLLETAEDGFVVRSLGKDQAPGGEEAAADIASDAFDFEDSLRDLANDMREFERKVEEGRQEAERLTERFEQWYYVIDGDSFDKLHLTREDLVKKKDGN